MARKYYCFVDELKNMKLILETEGDVTINLLNNRLPKIFPFDGCITRSLNPQLQLFFVHSAWIMRYSLKALRPARNVEVRAKRALNFLVVIQCMTSTYLCSPTQSWLVSALVRAFYHCCAHSKYESDSTKYITRMLNGDPFMKQLKSLCKNLG